MGMAEKMLQTTPPEVGFDEKDLAACIESCSDCAQACIACADACLAEDSVAELRKCITTCLNCADICEATGRILSRQAGYTPEFTQSVLGACQDACRICAEECERHAGMHEHCRICAEACRRCETACSVLLGA